MTPPSCPLGLSFSRPRSLPAWQREQDGECPVFVSKGLTCMRRTIHFSGRRNGYYYCTCTPGSTATAESRANLVALDVTAREKRNNDSHLKAHFPIAISFGSSIVREVQPNPTAILPRNHPTGGSALYWTGIVGLMGSRLILDGTRHPQAPIDGGPEVGIQCRGAHRARTTASDLDGARRVV